MCFYGLDLGTSIVRFHQSELSIWRDLAQWEWPTLASPVWSLSAQDEWDVRLAGCFNHRDWDWDWPPQTSFFSRREKVSVIEYLCRVCGNISPALYITLYSKNSSLLTWSLPSPGLFSLYSSQVTDRWFIYSEPALHGYFQPPPWQNGGSDVNTLSLMLFVLPEDLGIHNSQIFIMMMVTNQPGISTNHSPALGQVTEVWPMRERPGCVE